MVAHVRTLTWQGVPCSHAAGAGVRVAVVIPLHGAGRCTPGHGIPGRGALAQETLEGADTVRVHVAITHACGALAVRLAASQPVVDNQFGSTPCGLH